MEHENLDALPSCHRVDRGGAGVAAGRANDGQSAVLASEQFIEQEPEKLQRDILERQRGSVEELEQPMPLVELRQRRDRGVGETAVSLAAQLQQALGRQAVTHERLHDPRRQLRIGQSAQLRDLRGGEPRPGLGHIEPAVARQPGQRDLSEIERRRAAASGDIAHRMRRLAGVRDSRKKARLPPLQGKLKRFLSASA